MDEVVNVGAGEAAEVLAHCVEHLHEHEGVEGGVVLLALAQRP